MPVAMADIAFLLIVFFFLCSNLAKDPGVEINPPTTAEVEQLEDYPIVVIIDDKGTIFFQGKEIDGPEEVEDRVRDLVEGEEDEKARTVLLRCDKSLKKFVFEPVIEAIAKGGGRIAAAGEESKE